LIARTCAHSYFLSPPFFTPVFKRFTFRITSRNFCLSLLLLLPLIGWGQTTIVNYDFNSTTAPTSPVSTATGISSVASASKTPSFGTGTITGSNAYATNTVAGSALTMSNLNAASADYFQFSLDGAALSKYSAFKLYFQGLRTGTGPTTLTLQYSLNGGTTFLPMASPATYVYTPGTTPSFTEGNFDLSGLAALNGPTSLIFRLTVGGSTGGNVRVDNFQVQAINTVDPSINTITPGTVAAGGPDQAIALLGSNFVSGSVVSFNGQNLPTTYNSATSLTATIPTALLAVAGSFPIVVTNPIVGGSTSSAAVAFVVTAALPRWVGRAGNSWFEPTNWNTGVVPTPNDDVLLDHSFVAASYTVSFDQNTAVSIKSLTVNPGAGDSILVIVPATNTVATALTLSNSSAGSVALAIYNKGVVTNASGATATGVVGIDVAGSGATVFIYNGGSYRHASSRGHAAVAENISAVAGTELGIFDLRLPANGAASYSLSTSGRFYGTLILRNRPGQTSTSYPGASSVLTIQGNLIVGPGVTFSPTINNNLNVGGDIRVQGTLQMKNTTPTSANTQLVLIGTKPQTLSGSITMEAGIGLVISNVVGATLATPLFVNGPLKLTSGVLTTTATNLLTLGTTASLIADSKTSFINGPLARQTATGPVSNLVFPTGSGVGYRPVVLNASAQDANSYLVTQKEGPAADPTNLLASTSALPALTRVSRVRSYTVTPMVAANNFMGTITLSFDADDYINSPTDDGLTIGKNSAAAGWQNIGRYSVTAATDKTLATITSLAFTSFSDFALASTSADPKANPLPVVLTSFGATRQVSDAVKVSWAIASEQSSHHFEVQRSINGSTFVTIGQVIALGNSTQAHTYAHLDQQAPIGIVYYRLRQVDVDGTVIFSPVVTLAATATTSLSLYPNPTHDCLIVATAAGQEVQVLDLTGRALQTSLLPASGELRLDGLPAGTYLLAVVLDGQRRVLRFTKE
jgi:hypothetical protein